MECPHCNKEFELKDTEIISYIDESKNSESEIEIDIDIHCPECKRFAFFGFIDVETLMPYI